MSWAGWIFSMERSHSSENSLHAVLISPLVSGLPSRFESFANIAIPELVCSDFTLSNGDLLHALYQ
jgi:hypothetical protein